MISAAVNVIARQLNDYLVRKKRNGSPNEDIVVVSHLVNDDNQVALVSENRIVVSLVNIVQDTIPHLREAKPGLSMNSSLATSPPLFLNLFIVVAANFSGEHYVDALRYISYVAEFFQSKSVFTQENTPELDQKINKLILDIENLDIRELHNLWSLLGGRYKPSICYRVRMLTFDSGYVQGRDHSIQKPTIKTAS